MIHFALGLDGIEGHVDAWTLSVDEGKLVVDWFPGKSQYLLCGNSKKMMCMYFELASVTVRTVWVLFCFQFMLI